MTPVIFKILTFYEEISVLGLEKFFDLLYNRTIYGYLIINNKKINKF